MSEYPGLLLQQILLDVVSIFNKILALSQTKHSVKIAEGGIEASLSNLGSITSIPIDMSVIVLFVPFHRVSPVNLLHGLLYCFWFMQAFREYYPSRGDALFLELECVWEEDKFVLIERTQNSCKRCRDEDQSVAPSGTLIQYETMAHFGEG